MLLVRSHWLSIGRVSGLVFESTRHGGSTAVVEDPRKGRKDVWLSSLGLFVLAGLYEIDCLALGLKSLVPLLP